jgi:hypothetical protein
MSEAARPGRAGREASIVLATWLAVSAAMIWLGWPAVMERRFPDPDDAMRLLQVRDWLGGQSWFDVTQYRLNPPFGAPMHWSRLVDLPIAAVILLFRLLFGGDGAETAALVIIPLLTLGVVMLLVQRIGVRLMDGPASLLAALAAPASLGVRQQIRLMRIDHHGWQIALALLAVLAVLDPKPRRSGFIAGLAIALWLNISIEGLPFAAAIGAWLGLGWIVDADNGERLKAYLAALAGASIALFGLTHRPDAWTIHLHDVLTSAHLAGFAAAWLGCQFAVRGSVPGWRTRLAMLAAAGAFALAVMFAVDPRWMQAPFGSLDPVVKQLWYDGILEGQPVWHLGLGQAATQMAQPVVGLVGALVAMRTSDARRDGWRAYAFLLGAATVASLLVVREASIASVIALPGAAFLCEYGFARARAMSLMPLRLLATCAAALVMVPAFALTAATVSSGPARPFPSGDSGWCFSRSQLAPIGSLPNGIIAAPLDITPAILAETPHRAIGSSHHRNQAGIRDIGLLFTGSAAQEREILLRRKVDYLVFCPRDGEAEWYASHARLGLAAELNVDRRPNWLEPIALKGLGRLRVWRVRTDLLAA